MSELHQGERLKEYLRIKGVNLSILADKLKISRATLYNLFGKRTIEKETLDALRKHTLFTPESENLNGHNASEPLAYYQKENDLLRQLLQSKDEIIKSKEETIEVLKKQITQSNPDSKGNPLLSN